MSICCFCGHRIFPASKIEILEKNIILAIENGVTKFYSGGYGEFDIVCIKIVGKLIKTYPHITNTIVVPYFTSKFLSRYDFLINNYHATTLYPFDEPPFPRQAIIQRNKYMVENSSYVISYINYATRGAYKTYKYAIDHNKKVVNIGNYKMDDRK